MRTRSPSCPRSCSTSTATTTMPATYERLRQALGRRRAAAALSGDSAEHVRDRRAGPGAGRLRHRMRASSSRSRSAATSPRRRRSTARCTRSSRSRRCSASTITSARRRCRTCCTSASPTPSSNRSGTATTSTACRSPWPRSFGVRGPRPLLRGGRRDPRRRAEPSAAGDGAAGDGCAGRPRPGVRCAPRSCGCSARCGRSIPSRSCAASSAATATKRAWRRIHRSRRSPR